MGAARTRRQGGNSSERRRAAAGGCLCTAGGGRQRRALRIGRAAPAGWQGRPASAAASRRSAPATPGCAGPPERIEGGLAAADRLAGRAAAARSAPPVFVARGRSLRRLAVPARCDQSGIRFRSARSRSGFFLTAMLALHGQGAGAAAGPDRWKHTIHHRLTTLQDARLSLPTLVAAAAAAARTPTVPALPCPMSAACRPVPSTAHSCVHQRYRKDPPSALPSRPSAARPTCRRRALALRHIPPADRCAALQDAHSTGKKNKLFLAHCHVLSAASMLV